MYKRDDVLALETGILFIYTYYSNIQISLNVCLQNKTIKTLDIKDKSSDVMNKISEMRKILFKLQTIKSIEMIDYGEVARRLYYLGSLSRQRKLHTNGLVWENTINIIERNSFSAVFRHFISMLRKVETQFTRLGIGYQEVSFINIEKIQKELLQLGNYLQDFISHVEAVKIMLDYIKEEKIFKRASYDENFIKPRKAKPVLRVVKGSKS